MCINNVASNIGRSPDITLTQAQQQVVNHRCADMQVIACAGSGKTESISRRVASLVAEGADPASIVAFTFTERAANELKERITRRVAEQMGLAFRDRLGPMFVGTIHAYCFRILQDHVPQYGNYDVLDEHRHAGFLSREHRRLGLSKLRAKHWAPIRDFMRTVDVISNEGILASALDGTPIGDCYRAYREALDRYHFLTFGLQITCALEALKRPEVFRLVHGGLRHLLVDEYQDVNPAQEQLIELLSSPPVQLTVVGDDDQSIYQWRGSDVRNILTFRQRHPLSATVELDTNRRSRPDIVSAANTFAQSIPDRLPKEMKPVRPPAQNQIIPWSADTDAAEAERIAETIVRLKPLGYRYRDIAVLFRSVRTSAPLLIEALRAHEIPYSAGGRTGLFLQPEVAFIAEIYAWFVDGDWRDEPFGQFRPANLERIITGLNDVFGQGTATISDLQAYLEDWRAFVLRGHRPVNLVGDYYRLLRVLGAHRTDLATPMGSARMGALARFSEVLGDFEHVHRRGRQIENDGAARVFEAAGVRGKEYFRALHNYLLHYARDAYEEFEGEAAMDLDAVDILTVHQAKGLEWPIVFLPSLVQGRFPSRRAGEPQEWLLPEFVFPTDVRRRYEGGDAEERRLLYVALTRARDSVYLSCFERKTNRFQPSEYFSEIAGKTPPMLGDLPLPAGPESDAGTEVLPLNVSFSDLAAFDECGHRYRLSSVLAFQTQMAPELGYGRAIHHVLRQVAETVRASGRTPSQVELERLISEEFYVPFASAQAWEAMRKAARRLVMTYVESYAADLQRVWAVERPFSLHLDAGIISGRADVILNREGNRHGALAILDYKVATDETREARYREQLRIYSLAGRAEGLEVEAAYLHELKDATRTAVDISDQAAQLALDNVATRLALLRRSQFDPKPSPDRCRACEYLHICAHATL
ncbi:MAG TPA: ATP-dependent DNA helicase [Bryobacteraceae bacterium]|jgi:DNA helicase-2/ATP-dependent DNA helicase PcrA|nr:ATP-dependent DNA helicase [Bryobacteraceae bacterium]